jgi:hypothetical protein
MADELTFLMNVDSAGDPNAFYTLAKQYFAAGGSTVVDAPADGQTLEGVFEELVTRDAEQTTINLVSGAFVFAAMDCPVTLAEQAAGRKIATADDLQNALANNTLAAPGPSIITSRTRVVIYGCDLGRSEVFLRMLSGLFGSPGEVLAPRRLGLFADGPTVKYRQAQTWSLVRKPPMIIDGATDPPGGWPSYRTAFVNDAVDKFGGVASAIEATGEDDLNTMLTDAAQNATTTVGPSFFLEEIVDILPQGSQTAAEAVASLRARSNGDPVTATPKTASEVDDAALVTTITGADAFPVDAANSKFQITVAVLAQVLDQPVLIAEGPDFRRVTASKGIAPSPGPGGAGDALADDLQVFLDLLSADGVAQDDIDALVAEVPQGDATDGIETDVPDAMPVVDELDAWSPPPEELT